MGAYAAHCMAGTEEDAGVSFNFELFTHVTRFLGKKVVLLGLYNGQGVPDEDAPDLVSYSRSTEVNSCPSHLGPFQYDTGCIMQHCFRCQGLRKL